jgi:pyridoxal/pyridoxine/pyridoxamine kinase
LTRFILCSFRTIPVQAVSAFTSDLTGYNQWTGFRTTAEQVLELFQGLQQSGLDNFQYLLTGYLPNAASVEAIGTIAKKLKNKNPEIIWSQLLRFTSNY